MVKMSHDVLVKQLSNHGLVHRSVTVQTEGDYLPADADWNNKDIQHLNFVHSWANDVTAIIESDLQASVSLQKVLGITCPVVIVHYDSDPDHQSHFYTIFFWTVVTDIEFIRVTEDRTRVVSTYTVMGNRLAMLAFPVIAKLLRRNNRQLMSEDVPLRERRGLLRRWGSTFRGDETPTRDVRDSINVHRDNVVPPETNTGLPLVSESIELDAIVADRWVHIGRNDHRGVKLTRVGDRIEAFPRMCAHEGADLDQVDLEGDCLRCPWHGRRLGPAASLDATADTDEAETVDLVIRLEGGRLTVSDRATSEVSRPARS